MQTRVVGVSVPRKEGAAKLTGQARYIDDLSLPGMIFGATVRSSIARGAIEEIRFGEGIAWHEFTIVTAKDIPGRNVVSLIMDDQPCLADGMVNHPEEPILLLAHPDRHALAAAVAAVKITYKPAPSLHSIEESERREVIIWGKDNIFKSYRMEKGDVDQAWKDAAWIVEGEYSTGAQEQLYIEPNGVIAQAGDTGGLTIWGSMQCPFYMHKALVALTGLPPENVRVIQAETGGAFGGKEEYPSMIAGHAALLAMKSKRPVKIIYDRMEDMAATTKRHPSRTRHRTAISADGKLLAADIEFVTDGGAYATYLRRCCHAARSTPAALITGPTSVSTPRRMPPTLHRTARSAGSALRKACLRWSATWMWWQRRSAWRPTNSGGATCYARG